MPAEIKIIQNEIESMTDSDYRIFGTIKNIDTFATDGLVVEVFIQDAFGDMIQEQQIQTEPPTILPGETGRFSLIFKDIEFWDKYILRVANQTIETERE